jgi:hypothetical protein
VSANTYTDIDNDVWERHTEPGVVKWCELQYRLAGQTVQQLAGGQWTKVGSAHIATCAKNAIAALWPETERPNLETAPKVEAPTPRRIIQLSFSYPLLAVLCDDGSAWTIHDDSGGIWKRLPPIPQDTP